MPAPVASTKREHLMDVAWKLFDRDGFRAAGIDTVLAKAGVAKMTLYHHFASKDDLVAAVLEAKAREFETSLGATVDAAGSGPLRRLLAVFDWLEAWFHSKQFNGCAFIKAVAEYPDPASKPHRAAVAFKGALLARVTTLAEALPVRDAPALARQLMVLVEGAIVTAHVHHRPAGVADAREAARLLITAARRPE